MTQAERSAIEAVKTAIWERVGVGVSAESAQHVIDAVLSALDRGWQDISTAPRDGTTIFGANWRTADRGMVSFNAQGEWEMVNGLTNLPMGTGFYPTHWHPLLPQPKPPAIVAEQHRVWPATLDEAIEQEHALKSAERSKT